MKGGEIPDAEGDAIIESISARIADYSKAYPGAVIVPNLLEGIRRLYDSRHLRIHAGTLSLGSQIWLVILIGTMLTMAINYLYGMNFYLHLLTVSVAALMVASILFLIIALDRPFQGEFGLEPDGLLALLHQIDEKAQVSPG